MTTQNTSDGAALVLSDAVETSLGEEHIVTPQAGLQNFQQSLNNNLPLNLRVQASHQDL